MSNKKQVQGKFKSDLIMTYCPECGEVIYTPAVSLGSCCVSCGWSEDEDREDEWLGDPEDRYRR
jgi:uncharacterized OB-fold protein